MDAKKTERSLKKASKAKLLANRAYKNTEAKLRIMLAHYAKNGRILPACKFAGIDFSVHYRRLQNDPVYRTTFEEAEQAAAQQLEDKVYEWAAKDDLQAAVVMLKRFRPQLYRERASLEVSGSLDLVTALTEARNRMIAIDSDADFSKAS